jgi:hypothetical protein
LTNGYLKKFTIGIILPDFYVNGHPSALYKSITTEPINISDGEFLDIKIPINRHYFYYKNIGETRIIDKGRYYLIVNEGRKIKKV